VGSEKGKNRGKLFSRKICGEAASNSRSGDSARQLSPLYQACPSSYSLNTCCLFICRFLFSETSVVDFFLPMNPSTRCQSLSLPLSPSLSLSLSTCEEISSFSKFCEEIRIGVFLLQYHKLNGPKNLISAICYVISC